MDSKLERFLKLIELNEENYSCFFDAKITNVKVSNENKSWTIYIRIKKTDLHTAISQFFYKKYF